MTVLKMAWRNLLKERRSAFLNLAGLAAGLTCTLLIYLWIRDEMKMGRVHPEGVYQLMANYPQEDGIRTIANTPGPLADAISAELPEVQATATVLQASWFPGRGVLFSKDRALKVRGQFAGPGYFSVFDCPFVAGDRLSFLRNKETLAVSEDVAVRLFGSAAAAVGKTVRWELGEFSGPYTIGGVFRTPTRYETEPFDVMASFALFVEKRPGMKEWTNSDPGTFVRLRPGADEAAFNRKIKYFITAHAPNVKTELVPLLYADKYLFGTFENGVVTGGRVGYVRLFALIGAFILLIACVNFTNLSTARSMTRAKEVAVKKTLGAARSTLIAHFLAESILLAFLALGIAILTVELLLPAFNTFSGKTLALNFDIPQLAVIIGVTLLTGLLAGSYPAVYLSGFQPVGALKGSLKASSTEAGVRKGLVVTQVALSAMFIVSSLVIYRQLSLIRHRDLGYNRDHLVHFEIPMEMDSVSLGRAESFLGELRTLPGIADVSSYYHTLTGQHGNISDFTWPGKPAGKTIDFANLEVGYRFLETTGMKLKEGRSFSYTPNSTREIVFNETAIRQMGLKDPVGKTIRFWGQDRVIVGVVRDFHFESLYQPVKPCFFQVYPAMPNALVRLRAGAEQETLARIQARYQQFYRTAPFEATFLDENYQAQYAAEMRIGTLSFWFSALAILITCLGLFGLAAFTAQRRKKEIGIRKVIGASVISVTLLLAGDFLRLSLLALVLAFPLTAWALHQWLSDFAYRVDLAPDLFVLAGGIVVVLTLLTVGYQSVSAALANPVKSLKSE
jgi:putative ABC transport system permease protein